MTLLEFEAWVSDNYHELLRAAKRAGKSLTRRDAADAVDKLHDVIEAICAGREKVPENVRDPVGWVAYAVKMDIIDMRRSRERQAAGAGRLAVSLDTLGEDTYIDTAATKKRAENRRSYLKSKGLQSEPISGTPAPSDWLQGACGDIRWRYQQRRDAKLYDTQAVRSLGEHIRGRSSRSLHGAGRSLVHWGAEGSPVRPWGKEVAGYLGSSSWAFVSCSTGYSYKARRFGMGSPHRFPRCQGCSEHAISGRHDNACATKGVTQ